MGDRPTRFMRRPPPLLVVIAAFSALAVAILAGAAVHLHGFEHDLLAHVSRELVTVADLKVAQIAEWRGQVLADAGGVVDTFPHSAFVRLLDGDDGPAPRTEALHRLRSRAERLRLADGAVVDAAGRILLATSPRPPITAEEQRALDAATVAGAPSLVDLASDGGALRVVVPLTSPGGRRGAVVFSGRASQALQTSVRTWPSQSASAEAFLASVHDGEVVVVDALRYVGGAPYPPRFELRGAQFPLALAARGDEGVGRSFDHRGVAVLAARRRIPGSTWVLSAKVNEAELLAPVREREYSLTLAIAAVLISSGVALASWWRGQAAALARRERDVAERERLEKLQHVWKYAHDAVVIASVDGRIADVNDRAVELYGRSRAELLTMNVAHLRPATERLDLDALLERLRRDANGLLLETRHRHSDGSTFPVEASVRLLRCDDRELFFCIVRDITERRRAEAAAQLDGERLRLALDVSEAGLGDLDVAAGEAHVSPRLAAMFGLERERVPVAELLALAHPDDAPALRARCEELVAGRIERVASEHRAVVGGSTVWHRLYARAVERGEDGVATRVVVTVTDVTRERSMQARLVLADRLAAIGTLAAGVAHEINNPLAYVTTNVEYAAGALRSGALAAGRESAEEVVAALDDALDGSRRVSQIVRDLRSLSRARGDAPAPLDVERVLRMSLRLASSAARSRATIVERIAPVPPVTGLEHRLGQVFLNLLLNAAEAIPEGDGERHRIVVSTAATPAGEVQVEVRDDGCGMPPEVVTRMFDPFFTTKSGSGTGLGLSICREIVSEMNGRIEVESRPGAGTAIRVLFPAAAARAAPDAAREVAPAARRRVLVVDDERAVCVAVDRMLRKEHDVVVETSGRAALERIRRGEVFDVILCDLLMPEVSGMELHRELAAGAPETAARVVFMSGAAATTAAERFLLEVPNLRIAKPFRAEELRRAVASARA